MIITTKEAKEKWCSYMKLYHFEGGHYNQPIDTENVSSKCIASNCMSWAWIDDDSGYCGRNMNY